MKKLLPAFQVFLLLLLLSSERISAQTFSQLTDWENSTSVLLELKDHLFLFGNYNTQEGSEPWITDGTSTGTILLKDINPGSGSSISFNLYTKNIVQLSDSVWIFGANDGVHGLELWRTNGTNAGTYLVKDINAGSQGSNIVLNGGVNGKVFFSAWNGGNGYDTWVSDGTDAGTVVIVTGECPNFICTASGNQFYFFTMGSQNNSVQHLRVSDGTPGNTISLAALPYDFGSNAHLIIPFENGVMFTGTDSTYGTEMWRSDGTLNGTFMIKDIRAGSASTYITAMYPFGNRVFFSGSDSVYNYHLWVTNGTEAGTHRLFGSDTLTQQSPLMISIGNDLFLNTQYDDDSTHVVIWKIHDVDDQATYIKDIAQPYSFYAGTEAISLEGKLFFTTYVSGYVGGESWLWRTDGTTAGTVQLDHNFYSYYDVPIYRSFVTLCDSVYMIDDTGADYYTKDELLASTSGDSLHDFDLVPGSFDHARILFADDEIIFMQLSKDTLNYGSDPALFAYSPCGISFPTIEAEISVPGDVKIFPNPSAGNFTIQFNSAVISSTVTISISDVLGRTVFAEETIVIGNSLSIRLDENISAGMYLVTIQSSQASFQKLLEVQK